MIKEKLHKHMVYQKRWDVYRAKRAKYEKIQEEINKIKSVKRGWIKFCHQFMMVRATYNAYKR